MEPQQQTHAAIQLLRKVMVVFKAMDVPVHKQEHSQQEMPAAIQLLYHVQ
jgi:hypothetical protein